MTNLEEMDEAGCAGEGRTMQGHLASDLLQQPICKMGVTGARECKGRPAAVLCEE
jgi:hypothetical protein